MKTGEVKIVEMQHSDVLAVKQIEIECGLAVWKIEDYLLEINRKDAITKTAVSNKEIIGFILARLITPSIEQELNCAEIYNIAVSKKWRKNGIGNLLIDNFIKICQHNNIAEIFLEVRRSNMAARKFYLKNSFKEIAERKNYYTAPIEDALVLKLNLTRNVKKK